MKLHLAHVETPIGKTALVANDTGLCALEFAVRWALAVRRREVQRWFLFPLFNWYDALGLIPYFRIFRLFRVVSIYLRLHRSEMTAIGQDVVSRLFWRREGMAHPVVAVHAVHTEDFRVGDLLG